MIRRQPRSTRVRSSAASDVYKRQPQRASAIEIRECDLRGRDEGNGDGFPSVAAINRQRHGAFTRKCQAATGSQAIQLSNVRGLVSSVKDEMGAKTPCEAAVIRGDK